MDYALAQFNMIEQQVRPWDVLDMRILDVMAATPRHPFVPDGFESLAYSESTIPLMQGVNMLEPKIIGRFLQASNPQPNEKALEIGTGSGYQTALLAQLCHQVDTIDMNEHLLEKAKARLSQHGYQNIQFIQNNAYAVNANQSYDVIILNASVMQKPDQWLNALSVGGRCVAVVGTGAAMQAICYTRTEQHQWTEETLFETELTPLVGPKAEDKFRF